METLGRLFGSQARVKIIRLFLLNPNEVFDAREIRWKSHVSSTTATRELACLASAKLIKPGTAVKRVEKKEKKRGGRASASKKKVRGWTLDGRFPHLDALKVLLVSPKSFERDSVTKRFGNAGHIKALIISGIFIRNEDGRLDILIVGDSLKKTAIIRSLATLESEIGKELRYGVLDTKDFLYRLDMCDKFVRDILDFPHEKLIDKIGLA